jgi:hypothetical protein
MSALDAERPPRLRGMMLPFPAAFPARQGHAEDRTEAANPINP